MHAQEVRSEDELNILHANVRYRAAEAVPARPRFVALVDVLGMSEWLQHAAVEDIGRALLGLADQALQGTSSGFGPGTEQDLRLLKVAIFSDSILIYSLDDSPCSG